VLITRLLKFKASSCTITQYIEQILSFHLKNKNNYFELPVIIYSSLFYNVVTQSRTGVQIYEGRDDQLNRPGPMA
jgi:hypothetical protein